MSPSTDVPRRGEEPIKERNAMLEMARIYEQSIQTFTMNEQQAHVDWLKETYSYIINLKYDFTIDSSCDVSRRKRRRTNGDPFLGMVMPYTRPPGGDLFIFFAERKDFFGPMNINGIKVSK